MKFLSGEAGHQPESDVQADSLGQHKFAIEESALRLNLQIKPSTIRFKIGLAAERRKRLRRALITKCSETSQG